jgi:hypothetical protein
MRVRVEETKGETKMTQPTIEQVREIERSDNFRFAGEYWCVVRYTLDLAHSNKRMYLVVLFKNDYIDDDYWEPTQQRLFTMWHAANNYYRKQRRGLMSRELAEAK